MRSRQPLVIFGLDDIFYIKETDTYTYFTLIHPSKLQYFSLFHTVNLRKLAGAPRGCAPRPLLQISPNSHGRIWTFGNPRQICPAKQVSQLFHATLCAPLIKNCAHQFQVSSVVTSSPASDCIQISFTQLVSCHICIRCLFIDRCIST
jgi:hypothetical protein